MMGALLDDLRAQVDAVRAEAPGSSRARDAYERWFAQACAEGRRPDALSRSSAVESERFFAHVAQGADGHCYWVSAVTSGKPRFDRNDGTSTYPANWWWEHVHGKHGRGVVRPTCGQPHCITIDHLRFVPWSEIKTRYTDEQCIGALQVAAMRLGHTPHTREYDKLRLGVSSSGLMLRFSSWARALKAAGLPDPPRMAAASRCPEKWTKAEMLDALRVHVERHGFVPSGAWWERTKQQPSYSTLRRRFGSWAKAWKEAGL